MVADYADWGGLAELQSFLTGLGLAVQTDQATAAAIGTAVGDAVAALDLAVAADQATASAISASIAAAGVPLLHGYSLVTNNTTWTAGAAGSYFSGVYTLPSPAYQFAIQANISSASSTIPFPRVSLSFFTAASSGVKVDEVDFYLPATESGGSYWIYGRGPAITPYVQVGVNNPDPTYALSGQYVLGSSSLQIARHDFRSAPAGTVPGYTQAPNQRPQALVLASDDSITVSDGDTTTYLLPLWAGPVSIFASMAASCSVAIVPAYPSSSGDIYSVTMSSAGTALPTLVTLPRVPCLISLANAAATSENFGVSVVAQEFVS